MSHERRPAPGRVDLEDTFRALHELGRVYRRLMAGARPACKGRSLSPLAVGLLYNLAQHEGRSPSRLAEDMAMARPNVIALARELRRLGLVEHRRSDRGRGTRVALSRNGRAMLDRVREAHLEIFREMLGRLGARDLRALGEGARTVSGILGKLTPG